MSRATTLLLLSAVIAQAETVLYTNFSASCANSESTLYNVNYPTGPIKLGVSFTIAAGLFNTLKLKVAFKTPASYGDTAWPTPLDSLNVQIHADANGQPGAVVASAAYAWVGSGWDAVRSWTVSGNFFALPGIPKKYWVVLSTPSQQSPYPPYLESKNYVVRSFEWRANNSGAQGTFIGRALGDQMWYPMTGLLPAIEVTGSNGR